MPTIAEKVNEIFAYAQGTEAYHRLSLCPLKCTDSIKALAETAGAFWLVDAIGSHYFFNPKLRENRDFLVVEFHVTDTGRAWLHFRADTGQDSLATQEFTATDFPVGLWKFYLVDGVLMCPGDY